MKLSIITATYNSEASIVDCLESISAQTFNAIEHIVVDGASTDRTLDRVKEISPGSIIISEPDNGIYDALNKGISLARGDVIGLLHGDDRFSSAHVVEKIMLAMENEQFDGIYGDLKYIRENGAVQRFWKAGEFHPGLIRKGWMPPHPTLFLRKSVYDRLGPFDISFRIAADYDFILRLFTDSQFKIGYLPISFTDMKIGGVSNRNLKNILQKSREDLRALRKNHVPSPIMALLNKNISKIPQFFKRGQ